MLRKIRVPRITVSARRKVESTHDKFDFGDLQFEDGLSIPNGVPASKEHVWVLK